MFEEYYEIKSNTSNSRSIRTGPSVTSPKLTQNGDLFPGNIAKSLSADGSVYVFPSNVSNGSGGFFAHVGDTWRKLFENNGVPIDGWIAETHLGVNMITKQLITAPLPPPDDIDIVINRSDGITTVIVDDVVYVKP